MADLVITAASVIAASGATIARGTAGATIEAGQSVAQAADGSYVLADSNSADARVRATKGIALNGAADGQPLSIAAGGPVTIGATLTPGVAYYLSDTAGGICPVEDLGSGEFVSLIGLATSASVLRIHILNTAVEL